MAKEDLVLQKMVRVTPSTHAALVRVAAEIQTKTSTNTSMDGAIKVLLDGWKELERIAKSDVEVHTAGGHIDSGWPVTPFLKKHFWKPENETE